MIRIDSNTFGNINLIAANSSNVGTAPPAEGRASVMPEPRLQALQASGDVGAMIAALLFESGKSSREIARTARNAAMAAEDAAFAKKIENMTDAARDRLFGGLASGGLTVASGATAAGGELGRNDPVAKVGKSLDGGATIANTIGGYTAGYADIEKERADRAVAQAKQNVEAAGDMDKDAKEMLRRAMSYYAEYMRAKDDAAKALLFRA